MAYYVGLDVSLKTTAICVVDRDQNIVWQGSADTHPEMILNALDRWIGSIVRIGLETGSSSPWLARALKARNLPVIELPDDLFRWRVCRNGQHVRRHDGGDGKRRVMC